MGQMQIQGAHRTLKVVFQDFPGAFMSIFYVCPRLFNQVDIEQSDFHIHVLNQLPCVQYLIETWSSIEMWSRNGKVWR